MEYVILELETFGVLARWMAVKKTCPEIVLREGEPVAVILDIAQYREMLERLEDVEDLKMLQKMRGKPLQKRKLDEFLKEYQPNV